MKRLLPRLLVPAAAAAFTFAPPLVSPDVGNAQARTIGKYKGKTKFDRKMNETFTDDSRTADPGGHVVVTTAELIGQADNAPPAKSDTGHNARVRHEGVVDPAGGPYTVVYDYLGTTRKAVFPTFDVWAKGEVQRVTDGADGVRVRLRVIDNKGGVRVVIRNQDPSWDPTDLGVVTLEDAAGDVPLDVGVIRLTHLSDFDMTGLPSLEELDGTYYTSAIALYDPNGVLLEERLDMDVVGDGPFGRGLGKVKAVQTAGGDVKVVAYTESLGEPDAVHAYVTDAAGTVLLDRETTEAAGTERHYTTPPFTLVNEPDQAIFETYSLKVEVKSGATEVLGELALDVVVGDVGDETLTPFTLEPQPKVLPEATEGLIRITRVNAKQFEVFVALESELATHAEVSFISSKGPDPLEDRVLVPFTTQWDKWVLKGKAGAGKGDLDVVVEMTDSAGKLRDLAGGSTDALPVVLGKFGKGTKETASQTSTKPQLL